MDTLDHIGTGDGEEVVISLEIETVVFEPLSTEISLGQRVPLDHGAHRSVEQGDASGKEFA